MRTSAESATLTEGTRERLAAAFALTLDTVDRWALDHVKFADVAESLTEGYRRAQESVPHDWTSAEIEALHRLRQRVIIHRYQMELVTPLWPRLGRVDAEPSACAIVWAATTTLRCSPIWRRRIGRSRVGGHGLPLRLPPDRRIISKRRCDRPDACSPRNRRRSAGGWKRFGSQAARERALTMRDLHHCGSILDSL
jgi:hypothetical protein